MTNFGGLVSGGEARGAMAPPKFLLRSQHGQMLVTITFFLKGTSDIFTHIWPHLGLTQASPGPYPGLTRASLGPHPGLMRASPGPHEGLTRASPGPHPGTQVNTG